MITFFRNLRQNLIMENKTSRYLKYAIGEIILVVIGILIALQINNWNENRINRLKEKELEISLLSDFNETKKRLKETVDRQKKHLESSRKLIISYENNQLVKIKDSLPILFVDGFWAWERPEPVTKTYQSLISTGNINLLTDADLKEKLADFHAELDVGFEDQEESMNLVDALNNKFASYGFKLKINGLRRLMGLPPINDSILNNPLTEEDLLKLRSDHTLFNLGADRMVLEINRLKSQQKMANLVDEILIILNKNE